MSGPTLHAPEQGAALHSTSSTVGEWVGLPYTASGWHALSTSANAPKAVSSTVLPFCVMVTWLAGRLRVRVSEP